MSDGGTFIPRCEACYDLGYSCDAGCIGCDGDCVCDVPCHCDFSFRSPSCERCG